MTGLGFVSLAALSGEPIAPAWVVLPLALLTMVVLAGHAEALRVAPMPASRRAIRRANAWVMLFLTPMLAMAFGIASPARPALFAMSWTACVLLLLAVILLAAVDSLNTLRIHRADKARLEERFAETLRQSRERASAESRGQR